MQLTLLFLLSWAATTLAQCPEPTPAFISSIIANAPPDATFTSELEYEGTTFTVPNTGPHVTTSHSFPNPPETPTTYALPTEVASQFYDWVETNTETSTASGWVSWLCEHPKPVAEMTYTEVPKTTPAATIASATPIGVTSAESSPDATGTSSVPSGTSTAIESFTAAEASEGSSSASADTKKMALAALADADAFASTSAPALESMISWLEEAFSISATYSASGSQATSTTPSSPIAARAVPDLQPRFPSPHTLVTRPTTFPTAVSSSSVPSSLSPSATASPEEIGA